LFDNDKRDLFSELNIFTKITNLKNDKQIILNYIKTINYFLKLKTFLKIKNKKKII